jgi:hypothetical protein
LWSGVSWLPGTQTTGLQERRDEGARRAELPRARALREVARDRDEVGGERVQRLDQRAQEFGPLAPEVEVGEVDDPGHAVITRAARAR